MIDLFLLADKTICSNVALVISGQSYIIIVIVRMIITFSNRAFFFVFLRLVFI